MTVLLTYLLLANVDASSISLSSNELTLNGNANIRFFAPREEIWNGLANGKNFMIFVLISPFHTSRNTKEKISFLLAFFLFSLPDWPNESLAPYTTVLRPLHRVVASISDWLI